MEKESLTNQVIKNSFWNFLMVLFAKIGGLIFTILLVRFLLPEKFGIYSLATSIALLLLTFIDTGINQSLIRYVSEALGKKNRKKAIAIYKYLFKLKLLLTLFFAVILIIFSYPLSMYLFKKPLLFLPLLFSSLYLISLSFESFYESFFYIIKKVKYLTIKQILLETLRIAGVLMVFTLIAKQYYVLGVIGVLSVSTLFILFFLLYHLNKITPFFFENFREEIDKKGILKFLAYLSVGNALILVFGYVDVFMIGIFLPLEFVGFYAAALALVSGFTAFLSIPNILLPMFTQLKKEKLNKVFNRVLRYTSLFTIPTIFGILVLGKYIIKIIYGYEYLPATLPLYFLAFLIFELPLTDALKSLFSAKEKPKYFVNILIVTTLMNIVLNYLFIVSLLKISMVWAMTGAAIATLASRYFYMIALFLCAKKNLNITPKMKHVIKSLFASLVMFFILFYINTQISDMTIFLGLGEVILGILIYFFVMFIIKGIGKEDIKLPKQLFKK